MKIMLLWIKWQNEKIYHMGLLEARESWHRDLNGVRWLTGRSGAAGQQSQRY